MIKINNQYKIKLKVKLKGKIKMSNKLVHGIIGLFGGLTSTIFGKEIIVFIISLMPILELRGGLLAASLLGLDPLPSYIISIIGNILTYQEETVNKF